MIAIQLEGRLGNQLFQIAFGFILSMKYKKKLYLSGDIHPIFSDRSSKTFPNVSFNILERYQYEKFTKKTTNIFDKVINLKRYEICKEPSLSYSPIEFNANNATLFQGFWQSEKYFSASAYKIRVLFSFNPILDDLSRLYLNQIVQSNSVAIHIRRGDYVSIPENLQKHGICELPYYLTAKEYINERIAKPTYFIFSDDIEWVRHNMEVYFPNMVIVNTNNNDIFCWRDMYLMSICKHQIIANSTFSWWGAWLNINVNKIVIAPQQWFANDEINNSTLDLIPENWIRL